jgi:uracil-DNA glycosylase
MEDKMVDIKLYQKNCFTEYKKDVGFPDKYTYFYGNPINALVPIEVTTNKVMIIGAYPSAKFFTLNKIADVPLYDNDSPFSNELYFDGLKIRSIPSGNELNDILLKIGVNRKDCWITDLVKVFLFKEGHIKKYNKLGRIDIVENRTKFYEYAKKSLKWINSEISIANPQIIITLGTEVTSTIFGVSENMGKTFLDGKCRKIRLEDEELNIISLPHPGILIRNENWRIKFDNSISINAKNEIKKYINGVRPYVA